MVFFRTHLLICGALSDCLSCHGVARMDMPAPHHSAQTPKEPQLRGFHVFQFRSRSRAERIDDSDSAVPSASAWILCPTGRDGVVSGRPCTCTPGRDIGDEI